MDMRVRKMDSCVPDARARKQYQRLYVSLLGVIIGAAAIAAAIQSLWIPIDGDVSWLITVCERVLAGNRLYIDVLEVNPPASVWIYLPLVWGAGVAALKPEAVVAGAFILASLLSILCTLRLVAKLSPAPRPFWLAVTLSIVALILPMGLFAQREHLALILAFPSLAALAVIADGRTLSGRVTFASGAAAGLIIVIKPYFLLAVLAPAAWAGWKRRTLAPLLPGIAGSFAVIAAYGLAVLLFASAYLEWLPVIARTYAPMHDSLWKVATGPAMYPAICLGLVILLRPKRVPALAIAWFLGAAGFLVGAYLQAKNYPNHWLPQAGLGLAAVAATLAVSEADRARRTLVAAALGLVALALIRHWTIVPDPAVAAEIRRVAPANPKIIALSPMLVTGHPVTRNVDGNWVGSRAALFTAAGARFVGMRDPAVAGDFQRDMQSFADDVAHNRPDVVLVDTASKHWLMREEPIFRAMANYTFEVSAGETEIWLRRSAGR